MSRSGHHHRKFRRAIRRLDQVAPAATAFEPLPVRIIAPPKPGHEEFEFEVEGYLDENPSPYTYPSIGISNNLNGVLYVREAHMPYNLRRSLLDGTIPVGYTVEARGRKYRVTRADVARGEYAFLLSDMRVANHG